MGLLPLVKNMPLRIGATDPRNKNILFNTERCTLFGWTLHEETKSGSTDATVAANSCRDHISQDEADSLPNL